MSPRDTKWICAALGAAQLVEGFWIVVGPRSFYNAVASFGAYNPHMLRDFATWSVASGVLLVLATAKERWRRPLLWLLALQFVLHTTNHIVDVDQASTPTIGIGDVVSLGIVAIVLIVVAYVSHSPEVS